MSLPDQNPEFDRTKRHDIPTDAELTEAYLYGSSVGETASGEVRLSYESEESGEYHLDIPYDTVIGPDGLHTRIESELGEWVHGEVGSGRCAILVTSRVLEHAHETLNEYRIEAVQEGGIIGLGP